MNLDRQEISRRTLLKQGGAALTGLALLNSDWFARAVPAQAGDTVIPWLDQPGSKSGA